MQQHYDIIVIGAGSGGLNIASFMNRIGLSVLLIEKRDTAIGGDCLNYGCIPSKALLHVAREAASGTQLERFGVITKGSIDLAAVMTYVKERQAVIREHENAAYLREKGIDVVLGTAQFDSPRSVSVAGSSYTGKRIVIATGSRPRTLTIPGAESVPIYTNETIFDARELPRNLAILGGGPIGFEIGQAFTRLGSHVTIINRDDMWLAKEDRTAVDVVCRQMRNEGTRFMPNAEAKEVRSGALIVTHDGAEERVPCDALFVSIGRELNLDLSLDVADIETDEHGKLVLDSYLRTSNTRVLAVGDAAGAHLFTHAAELHVRLIAGNLFKPRFLWKGLNTDTMAWVTYTDPEIATFGRNAAALDAAKIRYDVIEQSISESDRAIVNDRTEGFLKLYVDRRGRILGGTCVGEHAGELVSELVLAMEQRLPLSAIFERVFPYPIAARVNKLAAGQYLAGRLSPLVRRLLRTLYTLAN